MIERYDLEFVEGQRDSAIDLLAAKYAEIAALREALTAAARAAAKTQYRCYSCKQIFDEDNGHGLARQHFGDAFRDPLPKCCEIIDGTANWGGGPHDPFLRVRKSHYEELERRAALEMSGGVK